MTYRFKTHEARDIDGFIRTLVSNGYRVSFREGGNARVLMCDVTDDKCVVRNKEQELDDFRQKLDSEVDEIIAESEGK